MVADIYNRLKTDYNVYKYDYLLANPPSNNTSSEDSERDEDEMDIYISNNKNKIENELITYLEEKKIDKKTRPLEY